MKQKVVYIDINTYSVEGFTSGLLITVKEVLKRLDSLNFQVVLLALSVSSDNKSRKTLKKSDGIIIIEYFFPKNIFNNDLPQMRLAIERIFEKEFQPSDIFIMSTPAVFFNPVYLKAAELLRDKNAKVKVIAFDDLFPNEKNCNAVHLLNDYISILKNFELYAVSEKIKKNLSLLIKKRVRYFPNLFNLKAIKIDVEDSKREYVTMINTHPIKGTEIFNALAKRMPHEKFMIVECWVDVPKYEIQSSNVKYQRFTTPIKNIYAKTKILIVPSLCEEGPARVIAEAALNGIPVIANEIGSISENKRMVQLVKPPKVKDYMLVESILFPVLDQGELDKCVERYVKKILGVTNKKNYVRISRLAKDKAINNISFSEDLFSKIVKTW